MTQFLHSRLVQVGAALIVLFWMVAYLSSFMPLNLLVSSLNLTLAIAVTLAYGREALDALAAKAPTRGHILGLGICIAWLATVGIRTTSVLYRLAGSDPAWLDSDVVTFMFFLSCLAAVLHLTAPHDLKAVPRARSLVALWLALALGAGVAGFMVGLQVG